MTSQTKTLSNLLEPVAGCLTLEGAQQLVELRASADSQARIDELARKSNTGEISDSELAEYRSLVSAGTFISILQSKARQMLKASDAA